jgi:hypothetical protein
MKAAGEAVALTLKSMINFAKPGMNTLELDEYGAHTHGDYGYHYHANPVSSQDIPCYAKTNNSETYPVYALLYGSWAGNVTNVPYFTSMDKPSQQNVYVGFATNKS